jgi:type I pantothenate kinase
LGTTTPKAPYVIGVAGSVAVGKSTTSRVLQALLSRWPHRPKVALIATDGFLYSLSELEHRGLLNKKGFPESYDIRALLDFLASIKSGEEHIYAPVYSHKLYDTVPNERIELKKADIVIIEGLNILQTGPTEAGAFVSDFFDFTIFVDAEISSIKKWFTERVMQFKNSVFRDPDAYFHFITKMSEQETFRFCHDVWENINERNLIENILPFKNRAHLILYKGPAHDVQRILLRKL